MINPDEQASLEEERSFLLESLRDLERENAVQFQFVLKGMGGFGSRITNILEDMIRGYQEREY